MAKNIKPAYKKKEEKKGSVYFGSWCEIGTGSQIVPGFNNKIGSDF